MALSGFDKAHYLNAKLTALRAQFPEWATKDAAFLETLLTDTYGLTAEMHYTRYGYTEGLSPNAFFNHEEYRFAKATDMVAKGLSPSMESALNAFDAAWQGDVYRHYLQYGAAEAINPSNRFDESQYLTDKLATLKASASTRAEWTGQTIDTLRSVITNHGMTVVGHYIQYGAAEGLTITIVPADELVDPNFTPWRLPHNSVRLPSTLQLDWVDTAEIITAPHKAIGQVTLIKGNQASLSSGFMISPSHVLTNAHALLDANGNFDSSASIRFTPGLNGDADAAAGYSWQQAWVQKSIGPTLYSEWPDNDLGIIKLAQPIGHSTGYLKLNSDTRPNLAGLRVQSAGYSAGEIQQDNPATPGQDYYQWEVSGTISRYLFNNGAMELSDTMNASAGASGSPVYYTRNNDFYLAGILSGKLGNSTVAAAMDQDSYLWILGILQQDGYYI